MHHTDSSLRNSNEKGVGSESFVEEEELKINCEFCGRKYPFSYSDIDKKTLEALKMVGDSVKWFCSNCEDKSTNLIEKFKKLENDVAVLQQEIARLQKARPADLN